MMAEISGIQSDLQQKILIFWVSLSVGLWMLAIARWQGFFRPIHSNFNPSIHGSDVIKGFGYFLFAEIFVVPALIGMIFKSSGIDLTEVLAINPETKGWLNLLIILGGFIGISFAYYTLSSSQRQKLWHQTNTPWYIHVAIGVIAWFVSYPIVLSISEGISLLLELFFQQSFVEQVAVQNVRRAMTNPILFGFTSLSIVTVVPFMEEFLFRGLLQSWLKQKLGSVCSAIVISSCVFAAFHFSKDHGMKNVELLPSLFLLSCMLGYLFERQRSLWASLSLHSFFNFVSLLLIYQE